MKKLAVVVAATLALTTFAGCGSKPTEAVEKDGKLQMTAVVLNGTNKYRDDDIYKFMSDKFKVDIEFSSMPQDSMEEKTKILISAGNMPDIMFADFSFTDYVNYSRQGMLKQLPEDYETKYPNIAASLKRTQVIEKIKKENDGKLFVLPNAMSFGVQYGQNNDVNIDRYCIAYRKDWAEKLGIEVNKIMKYDDFINLAKEFKKADLGGVGADNVVGLAVDPNEAPNIFVTANNARYKFFYKKDGKYVCGYNDPETLVGIKAYKEAYDEGVLYPGFYAQKLSDIPGIFYSGRAGLYFNTFGVSDYTTLRKSFGDANPGLNPDECIGTFWIEGKDGKVRGREETNYWSCVYFNPKINDKVFERALEMIDYCCSEEGGKLMNVGFEGKDYVIENNEIVVKIPADANGVVPKLTEIYPSAMFFKRIGPSSFLSPAIDRSSMNQVNEMLDAKLAAKNLDPLKLDLDMEFFAGEKYSKFMASQDINTLLAEIIVGENDVEKAWKEKVASIQSQIDEVCKEINSTIK